MRVIDLATTKTLLGITDTSYDTEITAAIPYIDAAVKQITRNRYNYRVIGATESGSTRMSLSPGGLDYNDLEEYIETGMLISGTGIPANAYIAEVFYNYPTREYVTEIIEIDLSANATETGSDVSVYLGINIAYQPIIAKAVWWWTLQTNTAIKNDVWQSRRMGPVSVSKQDMDAKVDGSYGVPIWLVKALPHFHGGH